MKDAASTATVPELTGIKIDQWGKDHYSLLAYLECRCVDQQGEIDKRHLRCNEDRHPHHNVNKAGWTDDWSTRIKSGMAAGHDDYDVMEDLEAAGMLKNIGTGLNPVVKLTEKGIRLAHAVRRHKMDGGMFGNFNPLENV